MTANRNANVGARAEDALATVEAMRRAGARRGAPSRPVALGVALTMFSVFGLISILPTLLALLLVVILGPLAVCGMRALGRRSGALGARFWGWGGGGGASGGVWFLLGLAGGALAIWWEGRGFRWAWAGVGAATALGVLAYAEWERWSARRSEGEVRPMDRVEERGTGGRA